LRQQQQINFSEETALASESCQEGFKSHYDLRNSALVPFEVAANYFVFTIPASDTDFQNTGLC